MILSYIWLIRGITDMNLLQREKSFHVLSSSLVMKSVLVLVFEYLK